jgi:hypothetical protein
MVLFCVAEQEIVCWNLDTHHYIEDKVGGGAVQLDPSLQSARCSSVLLSKKRSQRGQRKDPIEDKRKDNSVTNILNKLELSFNNKNIV